MIYFTPSVQYKKLEKLSPSQFYAAQQCPYKMVLACAYGNKPLLALSPNAYFGSVLHKLIESITKGKIQDETTFNEHWEKAIQAKDQELWDAGLQKFTPLKAHVKDIGLKKLQTLAYIQSSGKRPPAENPTIRYHAEMPLYDQMKSVSGKADLVVDGPAPIAIYDFKTGNITQEILNEGGELVTALKAEYEYQLKIYAHLYYLMQGKYPDKLFLVTLDKSKVEVPFTAEECLSLYSQAGQLLKEMNTCINKQEFASITHCSTESCKFCLYRPACAAYKNWIESNDTLTHDLSGKLTGFKVFLNGNACAYIICNGISIIVSGFSKDDEPSFQKLLGKGISLYNIKRSKTAPNVVATRFTTIYGHE